MFQGISDKTNRLDVLAYELDQKVHLRHFFEILSKMSVGPDTTLLRTVGKKKFEESDYFI